MAAQWRTPNTGAAADVVCGGQLIPESGVVGMISCLGRGLGDGGGRWRERGTGKIVGEGGGRRLGSVLISGWQPFTACHAPGDGSRGKQSRLPG